MMLNKNRSRTAWFQIAATGFSLTCAFTAHAGAGGSGGDLLRPQVPNGNFRYDCGLEIRVNSATSGRWQVSRGKLSVVKAAILRSSMIEIPESIWENGTLDYAANARFEASTAKPDYRLDRHFMLFSFGQRNGKMTVNMRVDFVSDNTGASASTLHSFDDNEVLASVLFHDLDSNGKERQIKMTADCIKTVEN